MAHIITISSGKGGVGKTNISVNLAISLAAKGFKTCLFDADLGLANANILLGMAPEYTLADLIEGHCRFEDLLVTHLHGMDIVPGSTGVSMIADLEMDALARLARSLAALDEYDYVIVDTSAGISKQVLAFCMIASRMILTVIPEPTSLTDAYSLLKVLHRNGFETPVHVVVNRSKSPEFGQRIFNKFRDTVEKFLPIHLKYMGAVAEDDQVSEAVARQTPFAVLFPKSQAARDVRDVAILVARPYHGLETDRSMAQVINSLKNPVQANAKPEKTEDVAPEKQESHGSQYASQPEPDPMQSDGAYRIERDEFVTQVLMALNRIADTTDRISEELSLLRESIKGGSPVRIPDHTGTNTGELSAPVIDLDFEKFVREKHPAKK